MFPVRIHFHYASFIVAMIISWRCNCTVDGISQQLDYVAIIKLCLSVCIKYRELVNQQLACADNITQV